MRKNFGAKPWTYPQPVLMIATYGEDGTPDVMNAAWGGISDDTQISICVSADHKTTENILARKAFTVSMAEYAYIKECDYVGIVSGNDVPDKFAKPAFMQRNRNSWTLRSSRSFAWRWNVNWSATIRKPAG